MKYDVVYFVGDSFVDCIGVADDVYLEINDTNRFSTLICQHLNLPGQLAGKAGCSNEYIFKRLVLDLSKILSENKTPLVICFFTDYARKDIFSKKLGNIVSLNQVIKNYYEDFFDEDSLIEDTISYTVAIQKFLKESKIDYLETTSTGSRHHCSSSPYYAMIDNSKYIGDINEIIGPHRWSIFPDKPHIKNGHANVQGHKLIYEFIIKKLEELYDYSFNNQRV